MCVPVGVCVFTSMCMSNCILKHLLDTICSPFLYLGHNTNSLILITLIYIGRWKLDTEKCAP